jgi:NhaA family Na+:H+ antiporter
VLAGGGFLCGICFTMALFIANLALDGGFLDVAKVGVLIGSAVCALLGMVTLHLTLPRQTG